MDCRCRLWLIFFLLVCSASPLFAQSASRVELPSGITVIHHDNTISHTAQVRLLVRSAPLAEGSRLGSGISNLLRWVLAERWRSLQGDRLGPLTSETKLSATSFNVTTADSQIMATIQALAKVVNPQEWSEADVQRARDQVLADLNVRGRLLHYI